MDLLFYIASAVAIFSTMMVITRINAVHALLYLVLSLLSVAVIFYTLGAPFIAALEIIIYAGAIMVLFIFVVMMLNMGGDAEAFERSLVKPGVWVIPSILAIILLAEVLFMIFGAGTVYLKENLVTPGRVGQVLFGKYLIAVELAAMMLMAGVVGAYHIGRKKQKIVHRYLEEKEDAHE